MRGIIPATMINYICEETGYEAHQIFDCIGGTSIGGLIGKCVFFHLSSPI